MKRLAILNGNAIPVDENILPPSNRGFLYGDGVFETMRIVNQKILFGNDHYNRLKKGCEVLKVELPVAFNQDYFNSAVAELLQLNKLHKARVRLSMWRNEGGFYKPESNQVSWLLTCDDLLQELYLNATDGVKAGLYSANRKDTGSLSSIKSLNCLIYVLSAIYSNENNFHESLILNVNDNIIETTTCNLFLNTGKGFITPPLADGCLDGVMRKNLIQIMIEGGISITEKSITIHDLENAKELLLTNVIHGIRWISDYQVKKYSGESAVLLTALLNQKVNQFLSSAS